VPLTATQFATANIQHQNSPCRLMEIVSGVVRFKARILVRMLIDVGSNEHALKSMCISTSFPTTVVHCTVFSKYQS